MIRGTLSFFSLSVFPHFLYVYMLMCLHYINIHNNCQAFLTYALADSGQMIFLLFIQTRPCQLEKTVSLLYDETDF